jgi:hypothetical protein
MHSVSGRRPEGEQETVSGGKESSEGKGNSGQSDPKEDQAVHQHPLTFSSGETR